VLIAEHVRGPLGEVGQLVGGGLRGTGERGEDRDIRLRGERVRMLGPQRVRELGRGRRRHRQGPLEILSGRRGDGKVTESRRRVRVLWPEALPVDREDAVAVRGEDPGHVGQRHRATGSALVRVEGDDLAVTVVGHRGLPRGLRVRLVVASPVVG